MMVTLAFAGRADSMTYAPQGGDNLWSDTSAWQIDGAAADRVPTDADDVLITDPAIDSTHPLTVASGTAAEAGTFSLGNTDASASSPLTLRLSENATLSAPKDMSYIGSRSSEGPVALIQDPGATLSVKRIRMGWNEGFASIWGIATGAAVNVDGLTEIGHADNAYCYVTNNGVFITEGLYVGSNKGPLVNFENFGTIINNGATRLCEESTSSHSYLNRAKLHINSGSSMMTKNGDFRIGSDGKGDVEVEGALTLGATTGFVLGRKSVTYDFKDEEIKHPVGTLRICGNGVVTNASGYKTSIIAGSGDFASGHLILADNGKMMFDGDSAKGCVFGSGEGATGTLTLSNNAVFSITKSIGMQFASGVGAHARLVMADQSSVSSMTANEFASGSGSDAEVDMSGSAVFTVPGSVTIASGTDASASVTLADDSEMQMKEGLTVGSGAGSKVDIHLRGGSVAFSPHATIRYLRLGSPDSTVRMSGWGRVKPYGTTTYTKSRYFNLDLCGMVVADGEEQSRVLDFNIIGRVNGADEVSVLNACGTNGWYAVNGGCLAMPSYLAIDAMTYCVGDFRGLCRPNMVNAFTVSFVGAATEGMYLHGSLYAPEHEDVPAGLTITKHVRPVGIWRIGYGDSNGAAEPGKAVAFTSADVTMKVGFAFSGFKPNRKVWICPWRYDEAQKKWIGGHAVEYNPEDPYVTFAGVTPCVEAGRPGWNLGWFAVTADDSSGIVLIIK